MQEPHDPRTSVWSVAEGSLRWYLVTIAVAIATLMALWVIVVIISSGGKNVVGIVTASSSAVPLIVVVAVIGVEAKGDIVVLYYLYRKRTEMEIEKRAEEVRAEERSDWTAWNNRREEASARRRAVHRVAAGAMRAP